MLDGADALAMGLEQKTIGESALRKARWRLIPLLAVCYGVAYIDRVNVSFASLQMNRDLHFSAAVYGLGAGVFFLSYAACEIPSNLLMLRFGARRWLSRIMVTWGLLAILMVFVRTPLSFYGARFLLGMAEAGFFPGVMYYLTLWFPREARARTVSYFYVALPLSGTVMGSLAGWLLNLGGTFGLAGWQWLFLVEGTPAVLLGVLLFFILPDGPAEARWLGAAERGWLVARMAADRAGVASHQHGMAGVLRDKRVWQMGIFEFCTLTVLYAYSFTGPLMLREATSLSTTRIGWVIAGLGLLGAIAMVGIGRLADGKSGGAGYIAGCTMVMAVGCLGVGAGRGAVPLIGSLALIVIGFYGMQGPFWALPATFLTGEAAAGGLAMITMLGIFGGFIGPYGLGLVKDLTGDYRAAMLALGVLSALSFGLIYGMVRRQGAAATIRFTEAGVPVEAALD
jgi:ACS family tartrate transporter-like MFS transporter